MIVVPPDRSTELPRYNWQWSRVKVLNRRTRGDPPSRDPRVLQRDRGTGVGPAVTEDRPSPEPEAVHQDVGSAAEAHDVAAADASENGGDLTVRCLRPDDAHRRCRRSSVKVADEDLGGDRIAPRVHPDRVSPPYPVAVKNVLQRTRRRPRGKAVVGVIARGAAVHVTGGIRIVDVVVMDGRVLRHRHEQRTSEEGAFEGQRTGG